MVTSTPWVGIGIFQGGNGTSKLGQGLLGEQVPWGGDRDAEGGDRNPYSGDGTFRVGTRFLELGMLTLSCV